MVPEACLWSLAVISSCFAVLWGVSLVIRNASIIDAFWGPAFAVIACVVVWRAGWSGLRAVLLMVMIVLWALRLGIYLGRRQFGHPEDLRYAAFRAANGETFWWRSFFKVFQLQAFLAWGLSLPIQAALLAPAGLFPGRWDVAGGVCFGVGLLWEVLADAQLAAFRRTRTSSDEVLDRGLWRYSRHPNYFGESLLWWGYGAVAMAATGSWWVWLGPAAMTLLLLRVSGVTLLESGLKARKPAYAAYVARTSAFVPWFPRDDRGA
jgi:steroid 5-alpha reductase family enzyme